jgi:anti-anti-sigma regulatory factor
VLISAHSNYVRRQGHMKLCSVDKRIENIFVITKLSLVFDVFPTEQQAIASFTESKPV